MSTPIFYVFSGLFSTSVGLLRACDHDDYPGAGNADSEIYYS